MENEEQGKISSDKLSRHYIWSIIWNKSNTKIFYFTEEYIEEEYLLENNDNNEKVEDASENESANLEGGQKNEQIYVHNAVCCSKFQLFNI